MRAGWRASRPTFPRALLRWSTSFGARRLTTVRWADGMAAYSVWADFGDAISQWPELTIAAYLGAPWALAQSRDSKVPVLTMEAFLKDKVFEPNPHHLKLDADYLRTALLVRTLAIWGPTPLVRSAIVCSAIQLESTQCPRRDVSRVRTAAARAAVAFETHPSDACRADARRAADDCAKYYAPFEDAPDSDQANATWLLLGACWFAAETAAQDFTVTKWDGPGPAGASSSWGTRNSVWPRRAADAAARVSSEEKVREHICKGVISWARGRIAQ